MMLCDNFDNGINKYEWISIWNTKQVVISAVLKSLMNMVFIADLKKINAHNFSLHSS